MNPFRISILLVFSVTIVLLLIEVQEADSIYAYAIKGIVKDVRLRPTKFIGGWFFKKAFILKKLKLKWKLKKKLILKKLLKKLFLLGRRKRSVRFPDDNNSQTQHAHDHQDSHQFETYQQAPHTFSGGSGDDYFQRYNIGSLGLSQTDLEQLRRLPENLKYEYGQEMEQLEAAASEPKEEEIQDYLSVANEFDNSACIPKSICEIMSRGNRTTNQFENQILEYYSDSDSLEQKTGTPTYVYDYAASLGKTSRDARICAQHFSSCGDSPQALNEFMNEVFTPEMCDSSSVFSNPNDNSPNRKYSHL